MSGKLIVIEGTDGSGKATQTRILITRLKREGHKVISFSFPQYGKPSAKKVEDYLKGAYGDPTTLDPYVASDFFAKDRLDLAVTIRKYIDAGYLVVLDRYVDSNIGHQGGKIADPQERAKFVEWVYQLEYETNGIPKPDLVIVLRVPAAVAQQRVSQKEARQYLAGATHDGHESNLRHLENAEAAYLWLVQRYPKNHELIECTVDGVQLPPEKIHEKIYEALKQKGVA